MTTARRLAGGLVPFALIIVLVAYMTGPGSQVISGGTPLPEVTLERIDFAEDEIRVTVRNTGPIPVDIVQGDVNDRIQPAAVEPDGHLERFEAATVRIPYPWNEAEPYTVGITIGDGTRFERLVEAAAPAVPFGAEQAALFAIVGTYIGIIPVFIGLMWLPFIRRLDPGKLSFFLALTVGLLLFLAADSIEEAVEVSADSLSGSINPLLLIFTVVAVSFLSLQYASGRLGSAGSHAPATAALMVSVGIGLHNFGEGLALGAALNAGSLAFASYLMAGFAIHNTTEGVAIAAPLSQEKRILGRLIACGVIAGFPAILGTWTGGFFYSPISSVVFLAMGAGAILQVVLTISRWTISSVDRLASPPVCGGLAAGLAIMYATSIIA